MSKDWNPAVSELHLGLKGVKIDDVGDGTKATASRPHYEGPPVRPLVMPIHQTSTYIVESVDEYLQILKHQGYVYSRLGTPNLDSVECTVKDLEGGAGSLAFTSGMAAISTAFLTLLKAGDHVVCCSAVYSGTGKFLSKYLIHYDIETTWLPVGCTVDDYRRAVKPNTRILYAETPCNPLISILDLEEFAKLGKSLPNCTTIVDSTFASPYLQKPILLGVDISVHSGTKYLGGHSDLLAGVLTTRTVEMWKDINIYRTTVGNTLSPSDCALFLRGIKSLHVRMERHCSNAMRLAEVLEKHPKIEKVYYPGLTSHPGHVIAKKQMSGFSGMISFVVKGGLNPAKTLIEYSIVCSRDTEIKDFQFGKDNVKIISLAVSLGGVDSLMEHPATMTHGPMIMTQEERDEASIADGLIRFSVGIEDVADLERDLLQALEKV